MPFFIFTFKRNVKYAGHAQLNYTLGFYCHHRAGIERRRHANVVAQCTDWGNVFVLHTAWNGFCSIGSPADLDLAGPYRNLTLHCTGRNLSWLHVPRSKAKQRRTSEKAHFAQIFTVWFKQWQPLTESWGDFMIASTVFFQGFYVSTVCILSCCIFLFVFLFSFFFTVTINKENPARWCWYNGSKLIRL